MEEGDALDELARDGAQRVGREGGALLVLQLDALRQVAALHVLEHQVERPTAALRRLRVQEGADQPHHAGVRQAAQEVHLAVGLHLNAALRPKLARPLDRAHQSSTCVHRSEHLTKRAVAELALRSEVLEGGQFGRPRCCGLQRRLHRRHLTQAREWALVLRGKRARARQLSDREERCGQSWASLVLFLQVKQR
eukprot:scaffold8709_cov62-Phaeocystis_antarctica.AAC.1